MRMSNSPLRLLVKSYADGMLDREQYIKIRNQLLDQLAANGNISHEDLLQLLEIHKDTGEEPISEGYSKSDWIIIALGLAAAAGLGLILFS